MQTTAQDLIERAAKYDLGLAADIRAFAKAREFGLVFEHNRPEAMRLYGKKISKGDTVHILAPRGKVEKPANRVSWRVTRINGNVAHLEGLEDPGSNRDVELSELVAIAAFEEPIYAGLKEVGRVERGGDKPYQVVINGENYHALEALLFAYAGRVDCIYIDPPYNTGARDWKYNNDYVDGTDEYRHSKWLAFMERRLRLAKKLLNPIDSVLICTIDEKEVHRLALLIEQVFPKATAIQDVTIVINKNGVARGSQFKRADECAIFVFLGNAKPIMSNASLYSVELAEKVVDDEGNRSQRKVRWEWLLRGGPNSLRTARPNLFYPIYIDEKTKRIERLGESLSPDASANDIPQYDGLRALLPIRTDGREATWRISQPALQEKMNKGYARVGAYDTKNDRYSLLYLGNVQEDRIASGELIITGRNSDNSVIVEEVGQRLVVPTTVWSGPQYSAGEYGSRYIKKFLGERRFSYPKSLYATEFTLRTVIADKPNALVIDFFSGSGTSAHAVMRLNHQDGGRRRCICVTNNEVSEDEAKKMTKQGLRQGDPDWEQYGICEYITKPRVKAAITGMTPDGVPIKGDYKFTDEFPMADGFEENAIFFDLTYQNPVIVDLDGAYEEVAPLLWIRAGCKGPIIATRGDGTYEVSETYAILFDYAFAQDFVSALEANPDIKTVYVVTDDEGRYQSINHALKGRDVVQLYESYLRSFEIAAEGALR